MIPNLIAEALGTSWLVFGGCDAAVLGAALPELGIGFHGVALAFVLTVVNIGLAVAGKHPKREVIPYIIAQVNWRNSRRRNSLLDCHR